MEEARKEGTIQGGGRKLMLITSNSTGIVSKRGGDGSAIASRRYSLSHLLAEQTGFAMKSRSLGVLVAVDA